MININKTDILECVTNINAADLIHTKLFIVIISFLLLSVLIKISHIAVKNFTKRIIEATTDPERVKEITTISHVIKSTLDILISLVVVMTALTKLGIDIRPILTAAGVLGVAVGFGAKRFVEDVITGLIILIEGQVRVGDVVQIGEKTGTVEKIDLKMIVLRDIHGRVHYVRNGMIDIITNMTRDYSYFVLELGIAYKENIDHVMNVIKSIFENELITNPKMAEKILDSIEILGVDSFADSSVILKLRIKTKPMEQWTVGREFNRLIKNKFDDLGIEIPFPQTTMHVVKKEDIEE